MLAVLIICLHPTTMSEIPPPPAACVTEERQFPYDPASINSCLLWLDERQRSIRLKARRSDPYTQPPRVQEASCSDGVFHAE